MARCIFTFAKNVYSEDYKLALELMEENKLTVSFELMVDEKHTEYLAEGVRRLTKVEFDGVGLLFGIKPAYDNAFVLNTAMRIIEDAFKNEDKKLVYASAKDITKKWVRIGELIETALSDAEKEINKNQTKQGVLSNIDNDNDELYAKKWSKKFINSLPNSSFAVIEPDYLNNKTDDKNARHLPFKDKKGKVDLSHYRNALVRVNQIKPITNSISTEDLRKKAKKVLDKYKNLLKGNHSEGENNMDKKANDALLAKQKEIIIEEFGNEAVKDWSDDDYLNQDKIDELRESLKANDVDSEEKKKEIEKEKVNEETLEEAKSYSCECVECGKKQTSNDHCKDLICPECGGQMRRVDRPGSGKSASVEDAKEEVIEDAKEKVIEKETKITTKETYDDEKFDSDRIEETVEEETKVDGKTTKKLKQTTDVTYTYVEMEEVKAEYEKKLEEKDKEIAFIKDNVKKVIEIRAELGDFVKELSDEQLFDETLIEIAKLKKENADLRANLTIEKASKDEKVVEENESKEKIDEELETGHEKVEESEEDSDELVSDFLKMKYNKK